MHITVPNFIKNGQTVAELSHVTVFKTAVSCHLAFLKFVLLNTVKDRRANVPHHEKIWSKSAIWFWRLQFFDYQDGQCLPFWIFILKKKISYRSVRCANLHCHCHCHQTAAEISHLTFFKVTVVRHLGFVII